MLNHGNWQLQDFALKKIASLLAYRLLTPLPRLKVVFANLIHAARRNNRDLTLRLQRAFLGRKIHFQVC